MEIKLRNKKTGEVVIENNVFYFHIAESYQRNNRKTFVLDISANGKDLDCTKPYLCKDWEFWLAKSERNN